MSKKNELEKALIEIGSEFQENELSDVSVQQIVDKINLSRVERQELQNFMTIEMPLGKVYPKDKILEEFLKGNDVFELVKIFPDVPVGALVYFKIKYRWPELRQRFIDDLQYSTKIKALQAKHNTISFLSTMVNTFIIKNQKGLMKYAMSGGQDDSDLPARFKINDFNKLAQYMRVIQMAGDINSETKQPEEQEQAPVVHIQTENVTVRNPDVETAATKASEYLKSLYAKGKEEEKK
jgi:hypothetical protein